MRLAPPSRTTTVTVDHLPVKQRLDFWRDVVCHSISLADCEAPGNRLPYARMDAARLAGVGINEMEGSPQSVWYTSRHLAQASVQAHCILHTYAGRCVVERNGTQIVLGAGETLVYHGNAPIQFRLLDDFRQQLMMVPVNMMSDSLDGTRLEAGQTLKLTAGHTASQIVALGMTGLMRVARSAPSSADTHLRNVVLHGLVAHMAELGVTHQPNPTKLADYHRTCAITVIERDFRDPTLNVARIAQAVRLSPAQLHRVFQTEPEGLMSLVWRRRVLAGRQALESPVNRGVTIESLAWGCGFKDAAHFSRLFKDRYGMPPSAWRALHAGGPATSASSRL